MKVNLERINKDYLFEVRNEAGRSVILDNKSKEEGVVAGISPMELVLMGVAGCSSIDIIAILNKQKINPTDLKMEVEGHRHPDKVPALLNTISKYENQKGIQALVTDEDGKEYEFFYDSNNAGQSCSLFDFHLHKKK